MVSLTPFLCLLVFFVANPPKLVSQRAAFQAALHAWYRVHQRKLPWRTDPSLYRTVVSELMLQQTQVVTVLPYFDRWLRELPDFAALVRSIAAEHGAGVLLIDHNMALIMETCDRIQVLDQGMVLAEGTPGEIRANLDVAAAYLGETPVPEE